MERKSRRKRKKSSFWIWIAVILVCGGGFAYLALAAPEAAEPMQTPEPLLPEVIATPEPTEEPLPAIPVPEVSIYTAQLSADKGKGIVEGKLNLHYVNSNLETLYAVKLHLTPNLMAPGSMTVKAVYLDDRAAYFTQEGAVLNVPLALEIENGGSCEVYIEYQLNISSAYGGGGDSWNLPGAIPAVMAYENGWLEDVPLGDVAYTPAASYRVVVDGANRAQSSLEEKEEMYFVSDAAQGFDIVLKW